MNNNRTVLICMTIAIAATQACSKLEPAAPANDSLLDGPVDGLTYEQSARFLAGDIAFNDEVFSAETGLGPLFVATSCGSCHAGDGKGTPFTTLTRFGQTDATGNQYLNMGGPQLQHRSLPGYLPEQLPAGATSARFTPPASTGLGFIELVSDADILSWADQNDANADGISGVPCFINLPAFVIPRLNAITQDGNHIGRFGKKAAAYDLLHQTVNAYNQDMGITSTYSPIDTYTGSQVDPEVSLNTINDVVFYLQTLKAPIQRNKEDAQVIAGREVFMNMGCEGCHRESMTTGYSDVEALSYKTFFPYTDLLLHDMGAGLNDGYTEGSATTAEWRTPALWGLGLSPNSQGGEYFLLHDGRAHSIEEAIQMHGGEATASKNNFANLSQADRDAVIKFLESL